MGRVFTFSEIVNKHVPNISDFPIVVQKLREDLANNKSVVGAILCGSVVKGDFNIRSDIDCVVVHRPSKTDNFDLITWSIVQIANELHIPLEFILVDTEIAGTKCHPIDYLFNCHLREAVVNGGLIKEDPQKYFSFFDRSGEREFQDYLKHKLEKFSKAIVMYNYLDEKETYRLLQKMLEVPVHIARKMLQMSGRLTCGDGKYAVINAYPEIASKDELRLFYRLVYADYSYDLELTRQLEKPNEQRYIQVIGKLSQHLWDAHEFVRLNALRF